MKIGASRGAEAQACDCKRDTLWLRLPLEEIKYLIFLFPRSGVQVKRGVEFRHSIRSAPIIREFGSRLYYTRLCAGQSVKQTKNYDYLASMSR